MTDWCCCGRLEGNVWRDLSGIYHKLTEVPHGQTQSLKSRNPVGNKTCRVRKVHHNNQNKWEDKRRVMSSDLRFDVLFHIGRLWSLCIHAMWFHVYEFVEASCDCYTSVISVGPVQNAHLPRWSGSTLVENTLSLVFRQQLSLMKSKRKLSRVEINAKLLDINPNPFRYTINIQI